MCATLAAIHLLHFLRDWTPPVAPGRNLPVPLHTVLPGVLEDGHLDSCEVNIGAQPMPQWHANDCSHYGAALGDQLQLLHGPRVSRWIRV